MAAERDETRFEEGIGLETRKKAKRPSLYRVVLLNDDYTTMEFVVAVLENVFDKSAAEATQIMLQVHKKGSCVCGVYTKDIAETKVDKVHALARGKGFPLKCVMERE